MRAFTASTTPWTASGNNVGGTVANSIQLTGTGTSSQVVGMFTSNCPMVLTSNTIRNLTSNIGTGTGTTASVAGILNSSTTPNSTLSQNTIFNLSNSNATAASTVTGIQFTGSTANLVERNKIYGLSVASNSATAEISGIRVGGGTTVYRNNMVAVGAGTDNAIGGAATNSGSVGINGINETGGTNSFFHNSVYIGGSPNAGAGSSYAFNGSVSTTNTRSYRDNIFFNARSNSGTATGKNYAVKNNGTTANPTGLTANNNIYFANGSGGTFGFFNSLDVANLAGWKSAVGQDSNSFEANPQFVDPANSNPDLHLSALSSTVAEGNGVDVGVTDDFDGQTRASLTPVDIGADAGNFMGIDLSAPTIAYAALGNTSLTTNRTITVTIADQTAVAGGGLAPRIYFNKNGGTFVSTACSLNSGNSQNGVWICTIDNSLLGGVTATDIVRYFVVAQDTVGNLGANPSVGFSGTDVNNVTTPPATPNQYTVVQAISGSFNVGTGETYTSLSNNDAGGIFQAINAGALTGDVVINITSDLTGETGAVALNEFPEDGVGGYTLTIKPSGGARSITGSSTNSIIRLNGADRVTIDGSLSGGAATGVGGDASLRNLTVQNTSTTATAGAVIAVMQGSNSANDVTIKNLVISGQDPTQTLIGIHVGGNAIGTSPTVTSNNDLVIDNCAFKRSFIAIFDNGVSTAAAATGNVITHNDITASGADRMRRAGIFFFNQNGILVQENAIGGIVADESADAIGIIAGIQNVNTTATISGGVYNAIIAKNRIGAVTSSNTTGFSAVGIAIAGDPAGDNFIGNNMISGTLAPSTSPDLVAGIFVAGVPGSNTHLYLNSVSNTGSRGAVASQIGSYALAISGTNPLVELKDNIFFTNQTSGGGANAKSYAIGMTSTTFSNLSSNYNDFLSTGANAGGFRTGSLDTTGTDLADLPAWKAATSGDANSLSVDPMFVDNATDLHIQSGSPLVNAGTTIAQIHDDIDSQMRDAMYDIGADELVDSIPPDTTIDSNPPNPSNSSTAAFTFSGTDTGGSGVAGFECQLDAGGFAACTSPQNYVGLSQGSHTFSVRAKDGAGNVDPTPANYSWFVDAIAPDTSILTHPSDPSSSSDATFTFSGTDSLMGVSLSFECKLDGDSFSACSSPKTYVGLSDGSHTFQVRAKDGVGNVDPTPASFTWSIETGPTGGPIRVTASAGTTGPTDYMTIKEAIDAINAGTHQGNIVIAVVSSTTETSSSVLNGSGAGPATYTSISLHPVSDGVTIAGPSLQGRGLIELNGADNVTIDGDNPKSAGVNRNLTLQNTASSTTTFTSVVRLALATTVVNSTDNVVVKNLNVVGSATGRNIAAATSTTGSENTTFGIFAGPGASTVSNTNAPAAVSSVSTSVGAGATAANLVISNNNITTAARAISMNGSATTVFPGLQITNNVIGNPNTGDTDQVYAIGITAQGSANGVISGNTVRVEGYVASSASTHGINVGVNSATGTFTIDSNKIDRVRNNNGESWSAYGINLGGGSNHVVQNNFVSGIMNSQTAGTGAFGTSFGAYGIRVASGTGHKVYHNSVNLYGPMPGATSTNLTAAFVIVGTGQTGLDVRNNAFSNQVTGGNPTGTRHAVIYLPSGGTSTMNLTLNNNAYFSGENGLSRLGQVGTTFGAGEFLAGDFDPTQTTPSTNLRSYTSTLSAAGTNDNASFATTSAPPFTSNIDLHIPAGTATRLESGGASVGVAVDIDADPRSATPDIGADEFAGQPPAANDMAATAFVVPVNGSTIPTGATFGPQAKFTNNGTAAQTNVTVRFKIIDSSMSTIYNQTATIASIAPLQSVTVTFPSTSVASAGTYSMQASAELAGDSVPSNDSISGTFNTVSPIAGTVTVGSGGAYASLTNPGGLFEALNLAGVSSDLTVNITSDLNGETGAIALNQLVESGVGGYTVTFKPFGAPRTISGTGATNNGIINLNGADRIVFDGSLSGSTDRSLTITNNQTGTSTIFWIKSASASNGANNNTIKNLIISGTGTASAQTTAGILAGSGVTIGGPAEAQNNNNTITNNRIFGVQNSIYNQGNTGFDQGWTVTDNEFGSTVEAEKNRFRGMLMGNTNNFIISGNTVLGVTNFTGTTGANSGIQLAFAVTNGTVVNNKISNVHNLSASGTGAFGMQLSAAPTTNVLIANNFIWDIQANGSATVASNAHGITVNGAATAGGYKIYHNSVNMNTDQVTSGTSAALNITNAVVAAGALDVRNNIFANTQSTGNRYGVFSAAAANTFGSINANDYFSPSVGNLGGVARVTLTDWQTATGQDANSLAVDPLFVSASDLHLQSGSPMRNAGVTGLGVTTDIDGDTRDAMPDIGADELAAVAMPGALQFSSATYSASENVGSVTITVNRTGGSDGTVGVSYATSNGTATGGASCTVGIDYVTTSGTLSFGPGETSKTFNVTICNDSTVEPDETINYTLSSPTGGATLGSPNTAVQTIVNDDVQAGTFTVSDVRVVEGNSGSHNAVFTVTYAGTSSPGSVQYATANGTATVAGTDYLAASGTLNFATAGSQNVSVAIIGDLNKEANETFFVNLSGAVNGTITDSQGVGIIIDDDRAYVSDFDRDLTSDVSVYRPSEGRWYILQTSNSTPRVVDFGTATDRPVPGDYDGDGKADIAYWRPSTGEWFITYSATSNVVTVPFGMNGDKPVQGDYDGDGLTDIAVFRPSTGTWWILFTSNGTASAVQFGLSGDLPVQGDYDGDGKTDIAVYRNGTWYILASSNGQAVIANFGLAGDKPVSGDFDGDGKYDLAIYRNGDWWIFNSLTGTVTSLPWGLSTDIPAPADYDHDGTTDITVFRPSNGDWYILKSSDHTLVELHWGASGDLPIASAYLPQ
jgi:hypothetical protein